MKQTAEIHEIMAALLRCPIDHAWFDAATNFVAGIVPGDEIMIAPLCHEDGRPNGWVNLAVKPQVFLSNPPQEVV